MRSTASTGSTTACSDERLDSHVDDMISAGFIEVMEEFHDSYKHRLNQKLDADYMKGIFQSIGFKEFHRHER
ncbi:tRNA dimethylallyltransferase-like [Haemaphysalis longicornis]